MKEIPIKRKGHPTWYDPEEFAIIRRVYFRGLPNKEEVDPKEEADRFERRAKRKSPR